MLALLASLFVLGSGQVKVAPIRLLLLLGLTWLALSHQRHQMLLGVTAPILLAPFLAKTWPAKNESQSAFVGSLAGLALAALVVVRLVVPVVAKRRSALAGLGPGACAAGAAPDAGAERL